MNISNYFYSPTSKNPHGFLVWCVFANLSVNTHNYS